MSQLALAIQAIGRLRQSWPWLADAVEPGRSRRTERRASDATMGRLRKLGAAERADRVSILKAGAVPSGSVPAPANLAAIDARAQIADHLDALAWTVSSTLRLAGQPAYRPGGSDKRTGRVTGALDYLAGSLELVEDDEVITDAHSRLVDADELARAISGVGLDQKPIHSECPACGRRSLVSETSSPNYREWSITCTAPNCRCQGRDCRCRIWRRTPGARHAWLQASWEMLAALLDEDQAA